jgi:hypothetical protein
MNVLFHNPDLLYLRLTWEAALKENAKFLLFERERGIGKNDNEGYSSIRGVRWFYWTYPLHRGLYDRRISSDRL